MNNVTNADKAQSVGGGSLSLRQMISTLKKQPTESTDSPTISSTPVDGPRQAAEASAVADLKQNSNVDSTHISTQSPNTSA